jgi:hypothetical protein
MNSKAERELIRNAVIGDAEAVGRLVTELGYPTTTDAMAHRLNAGKQKRCL